MSETISEPLIATKPQETPCSATPTSEAITSTDSTTAIDSSLKELNLSSDNSLSLLEKIYDLVRRSEDLDKLNAFFQSPGAAQLDVNETLKNGDTLLCLCCNKGLDTLVRTLVDKCAADINLARTLNASSSTSFSTITPTITITARRQSRLFSTNGAAAAKPNQGIRGDSPLCVCIKYGFDVLAEYLIERGAEIGGGDFERSPVQEAIRLNRAKVVERMFEHIFEKDDVATIEWMLSKRYANIEIQIRYY
jgi:ankyrin repeat protein